MRVLFRCDAAREIGFGHASRCLAWAEALREEGVETAFVGAFSPPARAFVEAAGFEVIEAGGIVNSEGDLTRLISTAADQRASSIVLDSYRLDAAYLTNLSDAGTPIAVIDDFKALARYDCALILNFTVGAPQLDYPRNGPTLLLGPEFLLCRRALVQARTKSLRRVRSGPIRNLLVAIAGEDPKDLTGRVVDLLIQDHPDICLHVIVASSYSGKERMDQQLASFFAPGSKTLSGLPNLAEPLAWADACIAGGGLIKYESAYLGVPVAVLSQNEEQAAETTTFAKLGLAWDLGLSAATSDDLVRQRLQSFVKDSALRVGLSSRGAHVFPEDPAGRAAQRLTHLLRNGNTRAHRQM